MKYTIGQSLLIGFPGLEPSEDFLRFVREENIGGVILFSENIKSVNQMKELTEQLQAAAETPLLIAIDNEGGRVFRTPAPFTHFPNMRQVAKAANVHGKQIVYELGKALGIELAAVGVNFDMAPVLDVDTNAFNPVIGDRSFSNDAHMVAKLATELIRGMAESGTLSCGKHFPGHGDTNADSHIDFPYLSHTRKRFEQCELVPFKAAIAAGVSAIMTAHVKAPLLDRENIVSTSRRVVFGMLRQQLGFAGLILSDDLNMHGISGLMSVPEAAAKAFAAGHDMLILRRDLELQKATLARLKQAETAGEFDEIHATASAARMQTYKARVAALGQQQPATSVIGCAAHKALFQTIASA